MHNNLKFKTIWKFYYLACSYRHWISFTKCSHISVTFSVIWDCWHDCQVFFSLNETFPPIQAVWKTSIVYIVIKTDGVKKSRAINKSRGSIEHQVYLARKQGGSNMKLTAYSDYICTSCNLHLKSFVLDWKWRRVNHILKNNRLAGLYAREQNSVETIKNRIWGARHPILTNITPMKFSMKISKKKILQKNKHHSCGSQDRCKYGNEIALSLHLYIYKYIF